MNAKLEHQAKNASEVLAERNNNNNRMLRMRDDPCSFSENINAEPNSSFFSKNEDSFVQNSEGGNDIVKNSKNYKSSLLKNLDSLSMHANKKSNDDSLNGSHFSKKSSFSNYSFHQASQAAMQISNNMNNAPADQLKQHK
jgi:hypothetical protein